MADSTLSITVRDPIHPCSPYRATGHSFRVQVFHCDGTPVVWNGVDYGSWVWMEVAGPMGGRIHSQIKVPPGCYLVRAAAKCKNVVTDWGYVGVGCDQVACVNLLMTTARQCILRMITALQVGSVDPPQGEQTLADAMPKQVEAAVAALRRIAEKLPEDPQLPEPPKPEEIREQEG